MRTYQRQAIGWILIGLLACGINPLRAQDQADESFITISGVVKDKQTKKRLGYVNLSVPGTSVGTITNEEGEFSIKVRNSLQAAQVEVSHIGYFNDLIKVEGKNLSDYTVWLEPNTNSLAEVIVRADDPRAIVKEALSKVGDNYVATGNMLTGFYRETAQKGRRYINISEAIIDIYKTPYANRNVDRDRVQIYKGRKLLSQKVSDTLAIKLLGGPNLSVYLDVVKNPNLLFSPETLPYYAFRMEESTMLNDRPHYVISFAPAYVLPYALYYGKLFIDKERLSFSSAEFMLSMDDQMKATEAILRRKPLGLRFKPLEVAFLATYKEQDGVSRLSYIRNEVRFKCDWKRKLFSTNYTVVSEMVVTDGREETNGIPYRMAFKADQSLSDKVLDFADEQFWGAYNIIEPTESLANAVHKLKKQQQ
ncbi:MAG: carboxypeptidase-like regulatory domain-containing protein [Parabacteroides sp.]